MYEMSTLLYLFIILLSPSKSFVERYLLYYMKVYLRLIEMFCLIYLTLFRLKTDNSCTVYN